MDREPNHICRNPHCNKGENGGKKHYYACDYCDRTNQWRAFACCPECFKEFIKANTAPSVKPERTDKTEAEVDALMSKSIEEVKNETLNELSDMKEVIEEKGIAGAIEKINTEIDNKPQSTAKKKGKKS